MLQGSGLGPEGIYPILESGLRCTVPTKSCSRHSSYSQKGRPFGASLVLVSSVCPLRETTVAPPLKWVQGQGDQPLVQATVLRSSYRRSELQNLSLPASFPSYSLPPTSWTQVSLGNAHNFPTSFLLLLSPHMVTKLCPPFPFSSPLLLITSSAL